MLEDLKALVYEHHRRAGFICCEETCLCWDIEALLAKQEAVQQSVQWTANPVSLEESVKKINCVS